MVVLMVTIGIWMAIYFRMACTSAMCPSSTIVCRFRPKPWCTERVRKEVAMMARIYMDG